MKARVTFYPPSNIGRSPNWQVLVTEPAARGYYAEAFANADALIDSQIESCLRSIYNSFECQDLINELHYQRSRANFDGMVVLEILKSKTLIDEQLVDKVRQFKKARNLVLHDENGPYALVLLNPRITYSSQEELDKSAEEEAQSWLNEAKALNRVLTEKLIEATENGAKYFSHDFYEDNPRGKMIARRFPIPTKTPSHSKPLKKK